MAPLPRQFLSSLSLSFCRPAYLSICLSSGAAPFKKIILRRGNIAPVTASDTKYHSSIRPPSLLAFCAQMASADGTTWSRCSPSDSFTELPQFAVIGVTRTHCSAFNNERFVAAQNLPCSFAGRAPSGQISSSPRVHFTTSCAAVREGERLFEHVSSRRPSLRVRRRCRRLLSPRRRLMWCGRRVSVQT